MGDPHRSRLSVLRDLHRPFRGQSGRQADPEHFPTYLAIFANHGIIEYRSLLEGAVMPTHNVNLTDELERFVLEKVGSGRYENASEVVRAALRALERAEQQYEAKLTALRAAIDEGDASGVAEDDVFARVRQNLNLPTRPR
jgi:antitoxin ParD1/3/4